ncbi:MAG: hypothetical protein ACO1Q7_16420 [Gemmatimonas sp.]
MTEEMMIIREYASEMEAIVAQNVLEANNIPSTILRDNAGGMLPVLQVIYPVRIAVRPTDADLALSLLDSDVVPGSEGEPPHAEPGEAPLHTTDKVAGSE